MVAAHLALLISVGLAGAPKASVEQRELVALADLLRAKVELEGRDERKALLELLEKTVTTAPPLTAARARFELLRLRARAGDLEGAAAATVDLGMPQTARLLGPFDNTGGARLLEPTQPEREGWIDGRGSSQTIRLGAREARFDIGAHLPSTTETRALLVLVAVAEEPTSAAIRLGTSGQVVLLASQNQLLVRDVHRPLGFDQDAVGVALAAGPNLIALRLGNLEGRFEARIRLTAPDGSPLQRVRWSDADADLEQALAAGPVAAARVPVVAPAGAIERFISRPPLHVAPGPGVRDLLLDAIVVEEDARSRDQRVRPPPHELWRLAYLVRLRTAPSSPERDQALSKTLTAVGASSQADDPSKARAHFEEALTLDPTNARAALALAELRLAQDLETQALELFRTALAAAPGDDGVAAVALDGLRMAGFRLTETEREVLRRGASSRHAPLVRLAADVAEERGDLELTFHLAERLAAWDRGDPSAHRLLEQREGHLLGSGGDAGARLVALHREALAHRPPSHRLARKLALLLSGMGRHDDAQALLDERKRLFPALAAPLSLEAELAMWRGQRDVARVALQGALVRSPQDRELRRMLRALEPPGASLAQRYALDVDQLAGRAAPPGAEEVGAFVVGRRLAARFYENGLGTLYEDRLVRVLDAEKARGFARLVFPYTEGREVQDVLTAERYRIDGSRLEAEDVSDVGPAGKVAGVYTDARQTVISFGKLEAGDLLHVRLRKDLVGRRSLFGDFFGVVEPLRWAVPVVEQEVILEVPASRPLAFGGRGAPAPELSYDGDRRVYRFRKASTERLLLEDNMPPWLEVADYLSVSSIDRWEELGAWYERLIKDALAVGPDLAQVAARVTLGARSDEEKARRLYEHVVRHTRYVGIELGIHGWRPYPVEQVHRRRYGDCKDKASLLIALLHEVGIEGRIVLVRTADLGRLQPQPPSMWAFNHAVAYIPSLDLFLDATNEFGGFRELPWVDQGAVGLVVAPFSDAAPALVDLPLSDAEANQNRATYLLDVRADGTVLLSGEERFRGAGAAGQRRQLQAVAEQKRALEADLSSSLPGIEVHRVEAFGLSLDDAEVGYRFGATLPHRAKPRASGELELPVSLYPHELAAGWARRSTREHALWFSHPWQTTNRVRYRLPPSLSVSVLPAGGKVESPHLSFSQTVERTADGFIVEETTTLRSRAVPAADYERFRQAAAEADALMRSAAVLAPTGPSS